ncbi:nuclear condensing complex subunit [Glomus cerebriforme]|uniref:Nuclear condensing complex subunit n=1 Tax=Glomus cerebriforme TaxID=658196 RepID=A0A397SQ62_9GLOM|nr:nuclear condensing complex subunit [Glomus cerebriforme]
MPVRENPLSSIPLFVPQIFQEVQKVATNHRKNAIALRKFQLQCSNYTPSVDGEFSGEYEFNKEFVRNINKILPVKKGQPTAERVVTFISSFVKYCQIEDERDEHGDLRNTIDNNTLLSRFIEYLLKHLLKGIHAKDKNVRFRVCQLINLVIDLIEINDGDLYENLSDELFKRLLDKEPSIRFKAVEACSKLRGNNVDVTEKLIGIMQNDPSADVRRAVLLNIEFNEKTIPYIFDRMRDIDASIRRDVYTRSAEEIGDFRILTIENRERLLKWGLMDRDFQVKKVCSNMVANNWIEHANNNLLEFLERIDVVGSNVAQDALLAIFKSRPDITQTLKFDESFWENLTIESVFLARVFYEFIKEDDKLDDVLPDATKLALCIQKYNNLMNQASVEEDQLNYEFIVGQLLLISRSLNYGDELGRRQMFTILREILMIKYIPEGHIESIVEIMKTVSIDERDFTNSMAEILSDIRETIEDEDDPLIQLINGMSNLSLTSMRRSLTSEMMSERERRNSIDSSFTIEDDDEGLDNLIINVKCLHIVRCILERNEVELRNNPPMYGLLNDIIMPNIKHNEQILRELSIQCLGLGCLLDQQLLDENLGLFIYSVRHGTSELQNKALMVIFDILITYNYSFIVEKIKQGDQILDLLYECLHRENPQIQAIAVEGIAKLMLSKMVYEKNILKELVVLYFDIETAPNLRLRQCLSYFFPAYCHSSVENQCLMLQICVPCLTGLIEEYRQLKNKKMTPPLQIAQQLIDWADPFKVVKSVQNEERIDYGAHADIAIEILKELFKETNKEVKKIYCQVLNKLDINESAGILRFKKLTLLTGNLKTRKPLIDAVSRNAFKKFEESLLRYYSDAPDPLDDNELEQLKDILDFIRNLQEGKVTCKLLI